MCFKFFLGGSELVSQGLMVLPQGAVLLHPALPLYLIEALEPVSEHVEEALVLGGGYKLACVIGSCMARTGKLFFCIYKLCL